MLQIDSSSQGYLSLNFMLYMDPIQSLLIPILLLLLGGIPLPGGSVLINVSNQGRDLIEASRPKD